MTSPPNPFESGQAPPVETAAVGNGQLDVGAALTVAWASMTRNVGPWIVVTLLGGLAFVVAEVTILGIFLVWPILMWGMFFFGLRTLDGEARLEDFFAGFSRYGAILGPMLGLGFLFILISIPGQGPSLAVTFATLRSGGEGGSALVSLLTQLWVFVWTFLVVVRFNFAPFLIVDRNMGAIEALKTSWQLTGKQLGMTIVWYLITLVLMLAGLLALCIGIIPASWVAVAFWAEGYRQITGAKGPDPSTAFG
ncbi:MAG: hypothetical protein U1E65_02235 [Myxococcota bacterium]